MATSSGLFLATIYNQSQLEERKHVAHYWSINTAATVVPLSTHPSPLVITTKLEAAILGGGCSEEVFCRPSTAPVIISAIPSSDNWRPVCSTYDELTNRSDIQHHLPLFWRFCDFGATNRTLDLPTYLLTYLLIFLPLCLNPFWKTVQISTVFFVQSGDYQHSSGHANCMREGVNTRCAVFKKYLSSLLL